MSTLLVTRHCCCQSLFRFFELEFESENSFVIKLSSGYSANQITEVNFNYNSIKVNSSAQKSQVVCGGMSSQGTSSQFQESL
jgi:hypothetical protein